MSTKEDASKVKHGAPGDKSRLRETKTIIFDGESAAYVGIFHQNVG